MTLSIGRANLANPAELTMNGDALTVSVRLGASSVPEMKAFRQAVAGLANNPDEDVVPVIWTEDETVDGFYRVTGVSLPHHGVSYTTGWTPAATINLQRVNGYANPMFEVTTQSLVRTNGHSVTTPTTIIAYGPAVDVQNEDLVDLYPDLSSGSGLTRKLSNGYDLRVYRLAGPTSKSTFRFVGRPAVYYMGAALLEVQYDGDAVNWYPVVGNQIFDTSATATNGDAVSAWRISNGMVRLTSVTAYNGAGTFEVWDNTAGAWESQSTRFRNGTSTYGGPGNLAERSQVRCPVVLRNSPEEVVVKVKTGRIEETWRIQRGAHLVTCHAYDPRGTDQYGIGLSTNGSIGGTNITGGIRVTSNDANGNRMVFACDKSVTTNTTHTYLYPTSATTSVNLMVGVELNGSSASSGNQAADLVSQFLGAVNWRQRVVRQ